MTDAIPSKLPRPVVRAAGWAGLFAAGVAAGVGLSHFAPRAFARPPATIAQAKPADPPPRGWRAVFVSSIREFARDRIAAAAASVTFYVLLALFPALSAFASIYGLFSDVGDVRRLLDQLDGILPSGALSVLSDTLLRLTNTSNGKLGLAFAISLLVSIWSSNAGVKALFAGLNIAYEAKERRGFIRLNLVSLAFTAGGILLSVLSIAAVVAAPAMFARFGYAVVDSATLLRWPVFLGLATMLLSLLYRFGPCLADPHWRWITPGGFVAALGWMAMSALFSWYVANFGHYDRTYGSLGAIVGFLTWIWLSLMVVLYGAELNSELEKARLPAPPRD